jgi:hypothetical protein
MLAMDMFPNLGEDGPLDDFFFSLTPLKNFGMFE